MRPSALATGIAALLLVPGTGSPAEAPRPDTVTATIPVDHARIVLAPYVWKPTGEGPGARVEAAMPGAYLKAAFRGSTTLGLVVDGLANHDCPPPSMPVIETSVDSGPFRVVPLTRRDEVYTLPLAEGLDAGTPHRVEIYFRAADLTRQRWTAATTHLRLAGLALEEGGSLLPVPTRPRRAIGFGDSITEGVGVEGLFKSWQSLGVNNARASWFPIVCAALGCEYGQLGTGGHGMSRPIEIPPLPETWDRYDPTTSRLTDGKLIPEPDYIFCALGTNDFERNITADYTRWLTAMRAACPNARFFCVVPPLGFHESEVRAAVAARHKAGDERVHVIDTAPLLPAFRTGQGPTQLAHDGVHPSEFGQGMLAAMIAVQVQELLPPAEVACRGSSAMRPLTRALRGASPRRTPMLMPTGVATLGGCRPGRDHAQVLVRDGHRGKQPGHRRRSGRYAAAG